MKTIHKSLILMLLFSSIGLIAQNISLSFENPQITNDGIDDFYEVDILIVSDTDYIQGSGQFFIDYNTLAFGENIQANAGITYERPLTSILGSTTVNVENYNSFIVNDNITSRVSFLWQQFWSSGAIGANNVTATPTVLVHVKMKMIDSTQDPMVCFDDFSHPAFDDQFFTACGPTTFAGADCFNFPGSQIFDYQPDCSGAALSNCIATTTWNGTMWDNGTPDSTTEAIINGNYIISDLGLGSIDACEITVNTGMTLTISSGAYLNVEGNIVVDGTLNVEHQGSVVQVDDMATVTNNGVINVNVTTPNLKPRDFMVMGSPMTLETRTGVFANAFRVLNHTTSNFVPHTDVTAQFPLAENFADDNGNDWTNYTGTINPAEGYLAYPQPDITSGNTTYDLTYQLGTLNNGTVSYNVAFNTDKNSSPNILANPYASAISATDFINGNAMIDEVYFWEHLTTPNSTFPGYNSANFSMEDISMRNLLGGVAAASDVGGTTQPNDLISTAQGFGIKATVAGTANFTNSMRRTSGNNTIRTPEKTDRIWLKVSSNQYEMQGSTLIGFSENASQGIDAGYDSRRLANIVSLYSHLEDGSEEFGIQSREAFDSEIEIPLGFSTLIDADAVYSISITDIKGVNIEATAVYLVDNQENVVTKLNGADYEFTSELGTFNNRFTLRFTPEVILNVSENNIGNITIYPNPARDIINLEIPKNIILESLAIYDLMGRIVKQVDLSEGNSEKNINIQDLSNATYLVRINTSNGQITKQLIKQ